MPLFSRAKITYLDTLKAEAILSCLKEQQVTILVLTPQVLQHFYQGMQRQLRTLPWPLRPLLLAYLNFSWRVSQALGMNPARPLLRKFHRALGEQFRFLCQRRGQIARGPGGEPGPAGIYGAGGLRPHRDRAGGHLQPAGGPPPGVGGAAPGRGGSQDSPARRGRRRRGPHPGRQRYARVLAK